MARVIILIKRACKILIRWSLTMNLANALSGYRLGFKDHHSEHQRYARRI